MAGPPQFSLRSLMYSVTLIGIALGLTSMRGGLYYDHPAGLVENAFFGALGVCLGGAIGVVTKWPWTLAAVGCLVGEFVIPIFQIARE